MTSGDPRHADCVNVIAAGEPPMLTTWPCFSEAMFLAHRDGGWHAQSRLWKMVERASLVLLDVSEEGRARAAALMEKYQDSPMALADATLVVIAERLELSTIFTLDSHFQIYRLNGRRPFKLLP